MTRAIRSELTRSVSMLGTRVFLALLVVQLVLPNWLFQRVLSERMYPGAALSFRDLGAGMGGIIMLLLAFGAWRVRSARTHQLHAQSFLVLPARRHWLAAATAVNVALGVGAVLVGFAISAAYMWAMGIPIDASTWPELVTMLLGYTAVVLIASACGMLIPSTAAAITVPLVWAFAVEVILTRATPWGQQYLAPVMPFTSIIHLISGQSLEGAGSAVSVGGVVAAWAVGLTAAAFAVNELADVK